MCALLISGKREQTPISLLHLIPFYLPIVATASLERADAGSRSSIVQARRTPRSRSSDISIPVREIRYLYLRININKRLARAVLTLIHTARSRTLSVYCHLLSTSLPKIDLYGILRVSGTMKLHWMFFFIIFPIA